MSIALAQQRGTDFGGTITQDSLPFTSSVTAGSLITASVQENLTPHDLTLDITDDTYTNSAMTEAITSDQTGSNTLWYKESGGGGTTTIRVTVGTGARFCNLEIVEWTGSSITYQGAASAQASGTGSPATTNSVTPSNTDALLIGILTLSANRNAIAGSSFTDTAYPGATTDNFANAYRIITSSPGSTTCSWSWSSPTSGDWACNLCYFEEAGGGIAVPVTIPNGTLTLTGIVPTTKLSGTIKEPIAATSLTLTSYAPLTSLVGSKQDAIDVGVLTLTGFAPLTSFVGTVKTEIPPGQLTLTGGAPLDVSTGSILEPIDPISLTLTSYAPLTKIVGTLKAQIPPGTLTLNSYQVLDSVPGSKVFDSIGIGSLTLTSYAPATGFVGTVKTAIPPGTLRLNGVQPGLNIPGLATPAIAKPQGGGGIRHRRKRVVIIDNRRYVVESMFELQQLLEQIRHDREIELAEVSGQEQTPQVTEKKKILLRSRDRLEARIEKVRTSIDMEDEELILMLMQ